MKILLVNSPRSTVYYERVYYLPSSLLYLAAVLQKNGEEVKILDLRTLNPANFDNSQKIYEDILVDTISNFQPELIGFGCFHSGEFPDVLKFSTLLKKKFPKIPIMTGGFHPTVYAFEILTNCPSVDWIVLAEGEETIIRVVNNIKDNRYEFDKIDGFAYRKNGKVIVNPKKYYIEDLDAIPFPAYSLINLKDYYCDTSNWNNPKKLPINMSIPIISSRSCPNHCNFCAAHMVTGRRWRARTPQSVANEIDYLYNKYNCRHFSFMDDNLTLKKSRVLEICNQITQRNLDIQFETPNGLSLMALDEEILDSMVSAGLVRIALSIESGSDFIRNKIMKKNLSREKIYEVVQLTKKYKQLYVFAVFIIGMPEETRETLMDTYNMVKEINVNKVYLQNIVPIPGSEVFEQAMREKLLVGINPEHLYKSEALSLQNANQFYIKPYELDLADLYEFRIKCENLIAEQTASRKNYDNKFQNT